MTAGEAVAARSADDLEDAEDDAEFADDRELAALRRKRMLELRAAAVANKFGTLRTITKASYLEEVTTASSEGSGQWVITHLFSPRLRTCKDVDESLAVLAGLHRSTKFLRIEGSDCIAGYPEKNCPTLLFYHKGECAARLVGAAQCGVTPSAIAANLVAAGALTPDEVVDASDVVAAAAGGRRSGRRAVELDDEDL